MDEQNPIRLTVLIKGLDAGGAERLIVAAAKTHRPAVSMDIVYLLEGAAAQVEELDALGVRSTCMKMGHEFDLRWLIRLRQHLRANPTDVLHMHSPYAAGFARVAARTLPKAVRPRLVTTEHNAWTTYKRLTRIVNAATSGLDDAVVTVSEQTRDSLPPKRRQRSVNMAHGIAVEEVRELRSQRQAVRAELGIDDDTFLIGTVANFHRKKDWPTLLHAARAIADQGLNVKFCAVGHGPLEAEVRALHESLGLQDTVMLTGYRNDAPRLMAGTDAFVLCSHWEGLPVALMEACALGLPIAASSVGGIPEHFTDGKNALLFEPGSPELVTDALLRLVKDDMLRSSLAAASSEHSHDFDGGKTFNQIEALYRRILAD